MKKRVVCPVCNICLMPGEERVVVDRTVMHPRCAKQGMTPVGFVPTVNTMMTITTLVSVKCWNTDDTGRFALWADVLQKTSALRRRFFNGRTYWPTVVETIRLVRALYRAQNAFALSLPKNSNVVEINASKILLTDAMATLCNGARQWLNYRLAICTVLVDWHEHKRRVSLRNRSGGVRERMGSVTLNA